ncbi:MAG: hypothetical protein ACREJ3_02825 [Polyangiaceae bacterium]
MTLSLAKRTCCIVFVVLALGCGGGLPRAPSSSLPAYTYAIAPPPVGSWLLGVEATIERAPSAKLVAPWAVGAVRDLAVVEGGGLAPVKQEGDGWVIPECVARCTLSYAIDLAALASSCHRMDCEHRVGDAVLGQASAFMLVPDPIGSARVRVRVTGSSRERFATGLERDPAGGYTIRAGELGEASYTAFGTLRRAHVAVAGARLDVAFLGAPVDMGDAGVLGWIGDSASCVAQLFGRFPTDATVFIVPVSGADHVLFGRVLSLTGASAALLFGDATSRVSQPRDWVVVHEFLHLGSPSFVGEGHWLEEGLATYYEPIVRHRAGFTTEAELWGHFLREMPRGLRKGGDAVDLEDRSDIDSTYWGGALFALLADIRIREATRGVHSLDDVMRAALAREGDATHVARVADFIRMGDEVTGIHALADVHDSWVVRGENVSIADLFAKLGVEADENAGPKGVSFDDHAPMADVRRAIGARGGR